MFKPIEHGAPARLRAPAPAWLTRLSQSSEGKHTIVLVQFTTAQTSRTFHDFESLNDALDGIVKMYEQKLKQLNPSLRHITYDINDLFEYIDALADLSCLVYVRARLMRGRQPKSLTLRARAPQAEPGVVHLCAVRQGVGQEPCVPAPEAAGAVRVGACGPPCRLPVFLADLLLAATARLAQRDAVHAAKQRI